MADKQCSIEGCAKPSFAREWCKMHYSRWYAHGDPNLVYRRKYGPEVCSIEGCEGKHFGRDLCEKHYNRLLRHGDPHIVCKTGPKPKVAG